VPRFRKLSEWENRETQSTFRQWEVFESTPDNILIHLRNIFSSKELDTEATTKDFLVVRSHESPNDSILAPEPLQPR